MPPKTFLDKMKKMVKEVPNEIFEKFYLDEDGFIPTFDTQASIVSHYLNLRDKNVWSEDLIELGQAITNFWAYCLKDYRASMSSDMVADACRLEEDLFKDLIDVPFLPVKKPTFTFIDLFAGIGGFRIAMQKQGGLCVFSSEWNEYAQKTYQANFGELPFGDITKESTKRFIPKKFDVLCAGFPCQPFSIAGVSKKNSLGRATGFQDKTQGTLFFDVADIINRHRPKAFYLENVKNLVSHDKGNTFRVIRETLEELDYSLYYQVMDGKSFTPQHRERIMIVGFDKRRYHGKEHFEFPLLGDPVMKIKDILIPDPDPKYTLSDKLWSYLQDYAKKHKEKGNGFGYGLVDLDGISRTLSARYYKDGSEILIPQGTGMNPRKLTPRECARLMGYSDDFIIDKVSDVQIYHQMGNSVVVPLITAVSEQLVKTMKESEYERTS